MMNEKTNEQMNEWFNEWMNELWKEGIDTWVGLYFLGQLSHASPILSPSVSRWSGLRIVRQLSTLSRMPAIDKKQWHDTFIQINSLTLESADTFKPPSRPLTDIELNCKNRFQHLGFCILSLTRFPTVYLDLHSFIILNWNSEIMPNIWVPRGHQGGT